MIEPRWFARPAIKPGYGNPEPLKPAQTYDFRENVEICLNCPLPACSTTSHSCPLYGTGPAGKQKGGLQAGDIKICDMIRAGWRDEPLCRELGISMDDLMRAKRRLKKCGKIS